MKLTNLRRRRGREWLWRSSQIPLAPLSAASPYAESGGWDECFPTVGPSPIPGAPPGTPSLPDHGELVSAEWTSSVYQHAEGTTLAGTAVHGRDDLARGDLVSWAGGIGGEGDRFVFPPRGGWAVKSGPRTGWRTRCASGVRRRCWGRGKSGGGGWTFG